MKNPLLKATDDSNIVAKEVQGFLWLLQGVLLCRDNGGLDVLCTDCEGAQKKSEQVASLASLVSDRLETANNDLQQAYISTAKERGIHFAASQEGGDEAR
ncbi:MAG: hypothetical protein JO117_05130 [Verrucomicrobia bacterium]|nr:hypothetical protein [Verrucomicrobiota bacterium]